MTDDRRRSHDTPRGNINVALSLDELTRPMRQLSEKSSQVFISSFIYFGFTAYQQTLVSLTIENHIFFGV
jgi:hypothetical protein